MQKIIMVFFGLLMAVASYGQSFEERVRALPEGSYEDRLLVVKELLGYDDPAAFKVVETLRDGKLYQSKATNEILIKTDNGYVGLISGEAIELASSRDAQKVKVNNSLRGQIDNLIAQMRHADPNPNVRLAYAQNALAQANPEKIEDLKGYLETEENGKIRNVLSLVIDAAILKSDAITKMPLDL